MSDYEKQRGEMKAWLKIQMREIENQTLPPHQAEKIFEVIEGQEGKGNDNEYMIKEIIYELEQEKMEKETR